MTDDEPAPEESRRQIKRRQRNADGKRSARLAKTFMALPDSTLTRLRLDAEALDSQVGSFGKTEEAVIDLAIVGMNVGKVMTVIPDDEGAILAAITSLRDQGIVHLDG